MSAAPVLYTITFDQNPGAEWVTVCLDFLGIAPDEVPTEIRFTPESGSVTTKLKRFSPCVEIRIPDGAAAVTAHDVGTPQVSADETKVIP